MVTSYLGFLFKAILYGDVFQAESDHLIEHIKIRGVGISLHLKQLLSGDVCDYNVIKLQTLNIQRKLLHF